MRHLNFFQYRTAYLFLLATFFLLIPLLLSAGCDQEAKSILPDFAAIEDPEEKKLSFFRYMRPIIEEENNRILTVRAKIIALFNDYSNGSEISEEDKALLNAVKSRYRVMHSLDTIDGWEILLKRVDIIPVELALIQAAKESGWGTSRFARMGYNMYGQRCFSKGCGIVPYERAEGADHEVVKYRSIADSVRSYIRNLNITEAYTDFRTMRFMQRGSGLEPDPLSLVFKLPLYSERREKYIEELHDMILANLKYMSS